MSATHTADGERTDFTGAFITRRTIDIDGTSVHRLSFDGDETTQTLLIPAAADCNVHGLQTGRRYEITEARYCVPTAAADPSDERCPNCDAQLRHAVAIDTAPAPLRQAAAELGINEPFFIATEQTRLVRADRGTVDDWQPMDRDDRTRHTAPDYVCDNCGEVFDDRDLHLPADGAREPAIESMEHSMMASSSDTMGLATGGAKDATNFRENIEQGYTPQPGAISTEGLFYDYYFETSGRRAETDALFAPQYAAGVSKHPVTTETEHVLSVGLDSTLSTDDFERPRLDLVAVVDVSGSMDSPFDEYYYDEHGRRREVETSSERKIDAATRALCALTEQLDDEDRLGVVLYNNRAHVAKPLRDVGSTDMHAIREHIREVSAGGGTNMEDGFMAAWDLLQDAPAEPDSERRVVFMTDMMPNMGSTGETRLRELFADAAADGIHTTFLGIGLDENADLADAVSDVRGANHYFVHSVEEFEQRLGEEFAYMVSPLVFDLQLELDAEGCEVAAVHGAPGNDSTDQLIHVTTLFPSPKADGETRGGVVLVELDVTDEDRAVDLVASWVERDGSHHSERVAVELPRDMPSFDHSGVRKATALARYASLLRAWAEDVHSRANGSAGVDDWIDAGRPDEQERESVPLTVPAKYGRQFKTLRAYLVAEANALGDDTLRQEIEVLETLCDEAGVEIQPTVEQVGDRD
ncbi:vWFA domain containing protein (plasmid) [Halapricum desulfuricans]|uniref:VWFA domain containing protein n=1 Tax=Halapricum desulfuricans TaxID=2841257 RepID=A0A897NM92_9EURY|nr:VWA domain-containing protein [Halapricum desulfuricans]QSG13554.1 vWFA domain containing protein [Halapricum desulfuricans]